MISAVAPGLPDDGASAQTTVASANGSPACDEAIREREDLRLHAVAPAFAASIASQTFADVSGMSMFRTPSGHKASITAFT